MTKLDWAQFYQPSTSRPTSVNDNYRQLTVWDGDVDPQVQAVDGALRRNFAGL